MDLSHELALGIDIGGTNTKWGVVNHRGEIVQKGDLRTDAHETVEGFIDAIYDTLKPVLAGFGDEITIKGIGVGAPNGNYYKGTIEYAPNLHWKGVIPMTQLMTQKFGLPCSLTNDANAAAVGEMMYGAARGMKDFIMITLGTGVGSGIVANGQLILGHDGFAGELGHTCIRPGGRKHWGTGLHGSLEAYCSATGIVLTAQELLANSNDDSLLRQFSEEDLDSKKVYECAVNGDPIAAETYRFTGQVLGEALANFVMFSSPEAIILFGGVIKAGDLLMNPTRQHMEANLLPIFQNKVRLVFSELKEADAAILGASALVWEIKE
ncbi:ROK family protein [Flaviaesturariibacter amylovorans]|uniref:ROK family protein n=1 Tax=Flaviaesturariibacter amylovorans TaxID=1084520 RepID=A0ABP8GU07_9BACT